MTGDRIKNPFYFFITRGKVSSLSKTREYYFGKSGDCLCKHVLAKACECLTYRKKLADFDHKHVKFCFSLSAGTNLIKYHGGICGQDEFLYKPDRDLW